MFHCVLTSDLERDGSPYSPKNLELLRTLRLVGFVNGVALLAWDYLGAWNSYFALWNPAPREFKVLRPHRPCSQRKRHADVLASGFDKMSNDFRSMRCTRWTMPLGRASNPHIKIVERVYACDGYFNGAYYWSCQKRDNNQSYLSLSFDFSNEVLKVHDPPVALEGCQYYCIGKYMDSLALVYECVNYDGACTLFAIFVMSSLDVAYQGISSSWNHLFTIGPFPILELFAFHLFRRDGDMLFAMIDDDGYGMDSVLYNPSAKTVSRRFGLEIRRCREYVESLFRLSKGHDGS